MTDDADRRRREHEERVKQQREATAKRQREDQQKRKQALIEKQKKQENRELWAKRRKDAAKAMEEQGNSFLGAMGNGPSTPQEESAPSLSRGGAFGGKQYHDVKSLTSHSMPQNLPEHIQKVHERQQQLAKQAAKNGSLGGLTGGGTKLKRPF
ncbi:MAG: hypothetical protein KDD55_12200 [Bdellovibrionales bacterium]|nr:hypothetical protein [Bdellovibrionales bacterium]